MGGTAAFPVRISGTAPFSFQWFFNESPMVGETNRTLVMASAKSKDVGDYFVVIANAFGSATTAPVHLSVEVPDNLAITLQPQGATVPAGAFVALSSLAVGNPPSRISGTETGSRLRKPPTGSSSSLRRVPRTGGPIQCVSRTQENPF